MKSATVRKIANGYLIQTHSVPGTGPLAPPQEIYCAQLGDVTAALEQLFREETEQETSGGPQP